MAPPQGCILMKNKKNESIKADREAYLVESLNEKELSSDDRKYLPMANLQMKKKL